MSRPRARKEEEFANFNRHIESLILKEVETRRYLVTREQNELEAGNISQAEFQDYVDDLAFEKKVLDYFRKEIA
jgi:hypothetical protein